VVKAVGIRSGQLDFPDERKIHQQPMVRLGGVSIFFGNLVALLLLWGAGAFGGLRTEQEYEIWGGDDRWGFVFFDWPGGRPVSPVAFFPLVDAIRRGCCRLGSRGAH
jgi:UDP-N-acetylmuramyl pentapeptide phosphotransferase/UDP-N-acetylglucosamine-1-phosphate transferase